MFGIFYLNLASVLLKEPIMPSPSHTSLHKELGVKHTEDLI